jgi:uncharacterized protein YdbL (DUF1318 family)
MMGRPRVISPKGATHKISTVISDSRYKDLQQLATQQNITLGAAVRLCLDNALGKPKKKWRK